MKYLKTILFSLSLAVLIVPNFALAEAVACLCKIEGKECSEATRDPMEGVVDSLTGLPLENSFTLSEGDTGLSRCADICLGDETSVCSAKIVETPSPTEETSPDKASSAGEEPSGGTSAGKTPSSSCICIGSVTVGTIGKIAAGIAGIDLDKMCEDNGGTVSGDTCSELKSVRPGIHESRCIATTKAELLEDLGIDPKVTGYGDIKYTCAIGGSGASTTSTGTTPSSAIELVNPLGAQNMSFAEVIGNIVKAIMGFVGAVALLMFIYGGLLWLTSGGSADKIEKGRQVMVWATIGLVIIFSSYGLVRFVFGVFTNI